MIYDTGGGGRRPVASAPGELDRQIKSRIVEQWPGSPLTVHLLFGVC